MTTEVTRGEAGVWTAEGNLAGDRAAKLARQREQQKADFARQQAEIKAANARRLGGMSSKFAARTEDTAAESEYKNKTYGLVTADEFKKIRLEKEKREAAAKAGAGKKKKTKKKKTKKKKRSTLSFADDVEEFDSAAAGAGAVAGAGAGAGAGGSEKAVKPPARKKIRKDPTVQTDFLPDREREAAELALREKLKKEWTEKQEEEKKQLLEITYSYWDGSGHRRDIEVPKGTTIGKFLEYVRQDLMNEFPELRSVSADNLLYIKEDLIIPQHFSFYDLILRKARGKSGPLFHFDVHDDVRMVMDTRVEKDESHPGKIVERRWYERNKHIFPASRWEVYDPNVVFDKYTIHGGEIQSKK